MKKLFSKTSDKIIKLLKKITFFISKTITAIVLVLSSLVGFNTTSGELNSSRLIIAAMIFVFGAPIGLMLFGYNFNMMIWFALVVTILFAMNLHNAWEVARSLKHGGLDYVMVNQAVTSVQCVVPNEDSIQRLNQKIDSINDRYKNMNLYHEGFTGNILSPVFNIPENRQIKE